MINRPFELPELKLLVDAIQSSKFITERKSNILIKKLEKLVSKYEAQKLQRQVYVSGRIKTMNESIYYTVDAIHNAISENKKIQFQYFQWNVKKKWSFAMMGHGISSVRGGCHGMMRTIIWSAMTLRRRRSSTIV